MAKTVGEVPGVGWLCIHGKFLLQKKAVVKW